MAEREIKVGLISYKAKDGITRLAMYGETVDVHEDDLKRFDAANGYQAPDVRTDSGVTVLDQRNAEESTPEPGQPVEDAAPARRRRKADAPVKPTSTDEKSRDAWVAYANSQGVQGDLEGVSVKEIAEMFSE